MNIPVFWEKYQLLRNELESFILRNRTNLEKLVQDLYYLCYLNDRVLYVCGNGGSASDSDHFVAELVGRFRLKNRKPIMAVSLSSNSALLTAVANDWDYSLVFARQVYSVQSGVLITISTSGESPNIIRVLEDAKIPSFGFVPKNSTAGKLANVCIDIGTKSTDIKQSVYNFALHCVCESLERLIEKSVCSSVG